MPHRYLFALAGLLFATPMLVDHISLADTSVVLGETTFKQVADKLGTAPIAHVGDAGASRYQVCYRSSGSSPVTYYLQSDEMGGGDHIDQFEAVGAQSSSSAEDPPIANECPPLRETRAARTDRGIMLGMKRAEVERRLGGKGRDSAGVVIYEARETRRNKKLRATAWSLFRFRYVQGRLAAFTAAANITD
jgi:hypothetical protein